MPLFGKSIASKYEEVASALGPNGVAGVADPVTWAALRLAIEEWKKVYLGKFTFAREPDVARQIVGNEVFRLASDGYVLGRIEAKTEKDVASFSGVADGDPAYEAGEFALVTSQAIAAGTSKGSFSGPPPSDVEELLTQFALQAGEPLIEYLAEDDANYRLVGEANGRAVNLGREIALMENFYTNPKKRRELMKIRERFQAEQLLHMQEVKSELERAGIETPSDWADQMMRKVYDRIRQ